MDYLHAISNITTRCHQLSHNLILNHMLMIYFMCILTLDMLIMLQYQSLQVFTYGVSEQQQLEIFNGGDGTVSNQLHQSCRQRLPLKHNRRCKSVSTVKPQSYSTFMTKKK